MSSVSKTFQELITFSRSTNGTYVNSAGYITNTPVVNYLPYSNQFENAVWSKQNSFIQTNLFLYSQEFDNPNWGMLNVATPTANTTIAPNGTLTADTVTASAGTASRNISQSSGGLTLVPMTVSVYAKANTLGFLQIFHGSASSAYANFNLITGAVGTVGAVTAAMTSAGNGWYRCSISFTPSAPSNIRLALISSATAVYNESWAAAGTESIFLWGAQVVRGSVPGDYRATTTAALPILYPDYNGQLRARKFCDDASVSTRHAMYQSTAMTLQSTPFSASVYLKADSRTYALVGVGLGRFTSCIVNLTTGVAGAFSGSEASNVSATTFNVGNGWWRVVITGTFSVSDSGYLWVGVSDGNEYYTGDGSSGIYVADSQLEPGTPVGPYYDTSTTLTYAPRLDYNPVTLQPRGLLIEESRANLLLYSDQFNIAPWTTGGTATILPNTTLAPDGTQGADEIVYVSSGSRVTQQITAAFSGSATYSIYLKASSVDTGATLLIYNLTTLASLASSSIASLTSGGFDAGNGWRRYSVTAASGITAGNAILVYCYTDSVNGTVVGGRLYAWGAQLEQGAFATSYIPTVGSQLTRAADTASVNTLSPWYNSTAGTFYFEGDTAAPSLAILRTLTNMNDGTVNNMHRMYLYSGTVAGQTTAGGVTQADIGGSSYTVNTAFKFAYAVTANNFAAVLNGGAPATDAAGTMPTGLTTFEMASNFAGTVNTGHIRRITYYPQRLTNAQLQSITT